MKFTTDPIGDMLTRIRNAQRARRSECVVPWSKIKEQLCVILRDKKWIQDVRVLGEHPKKYMVVSFKPDKMNLELKRISKPGRRIYKGKAELKPVLQGFGMAVLTTSLGIMTDKEAREKKAGGEVIFTVS